MDRANPPKHLAYLDGLRAVAAVYVLLCHAFLQVDFTHTSLGNATKFALQFFFFGHFAVDLFIVLSGFCLMLPVITNDGELRGGATHFFRRRAWRIIPPYYAAMALSLLLIRFFIGQKTGTHWDVSLPVTGKGVLIHLLLLQDLLGYETDINHVFWSISVEWRIYFLFPLLLLGWRRFGPVVSAAVAVLLSYLLLQLCQGYIGSTLAAHYIGLFVMGMFGASMAFAPDGASGKLRRLPWSLVTVFMTLVIFLMFFPRLWDGPHPRVYVADYLVGVWSTALLVTVSCNQESWLRKLLGARPVVFVGTFAYSVYLIHAPLLQVLWQYVFAPLQTRPMQMFAALTLAGTPLIIAASYVFFLLFERPFLSPPVRPLAAGRKQVGAAILSGSSLP